MFPLTYTVKTVPYTLRDELGREESRWRRSAARGGRLDRREHVAIIGGLVALRGAGAARKHPRAGPVQQQRPGGRARPEGGGPGGGAGHVSAPRHPRPRDPA